MNDLLIRAEKGVSVATWPAIGSVVRESTACWQINAFEVSQQRGRNWSGHDYSLLAPASAYIVLVTDQKTHIIESIMEKLAAIQAANSNSSATEAKNAVSRALSLAYELDSKNESRTAARQLMRFIEGRLSGNALSTVNFLLLTADTSKLSSRSMIGLVRATARLRAKLPAWKPAYERSWHSVSALGKDPRVVFVGLEKISESAGVGAP